MNAEQPIGVFDSGVGGISVLREIAALLPAEDYIYYNRLGYKRTGRSARTGSQAAVS